MLLHPKYETFCRNYARSGNGTQAARDSGFAYDHAANQAFRLLKRADVQARLAELAAEQERDDAEFLAEREARRAKLAAMAATEAETLLAKLDPLYEDRLEAGDHATAMKVVALQARIAGLLVSEDEGPRKTRARRGNSSSEDGLGLV